jgi:hypothetical protein
MCDESDVSKDRLLYWTYYMLYYAEWVNAPGCAKTIFTELAAIEAGDPGFGWVLTA